MAELRPAEGRGGRPKSILPIEYMFGKREIFGQRRLFDKKSKGVVKIKTEITNNFQKKAKHHLIV